MAALLYVVAALTWAGGLLGAGLVVFLSGGRGEATVLAGVYLGAAFAAGVIPLGLGAVLSKLGKIEAALAKR